MTYIIAIGIGIVIGAVGMLLFLMIFDEMQNGR